MQAAVVVLLITLPWLNPFTPGPTSGMGPLLFAWVCAAGVLLMWAWDRTRGETTTTVRAVVSGWAAAAGLSAVIGVLQYFGHTAAFGEWINHTGVGTAFGNLRQRNQFATLLNIGLLAVLWLASSQSAPHAGAPTAPRQPWRLPLALLAAALLSVGNAASSSRTGLFQLVLIIVLMLWWLHGSVGASLRQARHLHVVLLAAALSFAAATVALPLLAGLDPSSTGAWARLQAADPPCASRITLWGNVLTLIAQKPWLGWGWGELDYAHFVTLYPGRRFCDILDNAHNLPLHLAVELGLPLAALACATVLWLTVRAKPWAERNPTRQMAWGVLAVIGLHSMLEYPLWYGPFQMAAGLSVWLLWWVPREGAQERRFKSWVPKVHYLYALTAVVLMVYSGFFTWNYYLVSQLYLRSEDRAPAYRVNTLPKVRGVWLQQDTVRFAELTTTELTAANAEYLNALGKDMLHFSPENKVVRIIINSAQMLGRDDEVAFYATRLQLAFPKAYEAWQDEQRESRIPSP